MISISFIESYLLPTIYALLTIGFIAIVSLMGLRIRQLSIYQNRVSKLMHGKNKPMDVAYQKNLIQLLEQVFAISSKVMHSNPKVKKYLDTLSARIIKSGISWKHGTIKLALLKIILPGCFGYILFLLNHHILLEYLGIDHALLCIIIGILIGKKAIDRYLDRSMIRYRTHIRKALPDALELLTICLDAGYSNENALGKIAYEFTHIFPEIANELSITESELKVLPNRATAWKNLANRTELPEINATVSVFLQNDSYGTPLVGPLKAQIDILRRDRVISAEEKAAKIPVLLAIPLSLFFLPIIFITILTPAVLRSFNVI